jgi:hypothetical protein
MRVLLITPPMVQLNTPYAATPALAGSLRERGVEARQADLSLALALRLFSRAGLEALHAELRRAARRRAPLPRSARHFLRHAEAYLDTVEPAVRYLQGCDPSLGQRIVTRSFLPEGPRFRAQAGPGGEELAARLRWAFGALGLADEARHLASLYLDDLADTIRDALDPLFELARYGETLARHAPRFTPLRRALEARPTLVGRLLDALTAEVLREHRPDLLALTVPFPGTLLGALRIARAAKRLHPRLPVALGGCYVNTELRGLAEPGLFRTVDYVGLDDGEAPLCALVEHLAGHRPRERLVRTFALRRGRVEWLDDARTRDVPHARAGTPVYDGLPLDRYLSVLEMLNPVTRLWSEGRWTKLQLARGCYWHRCRFCDVSLPHIRRYDPAPVAVLADRIESVAAATGQTGFHFVDEALPPALLRRLSEELLRRRLACTWWGNIRFEKPFTPILARLMARAGCVAVTGGLEAATDRLLTLVEKGFTLAQVVRVTRALSEAGILVHTYLMYGLPTQTEQDTVDALEFVRQLFEAGTVQSAYWHRFALTAHSPIAADPARYGIRLLPRPRAPFALNEIPFADPAAADPAALASGLNKAAYNFMQGVGIEADVRVWFDRVVPPPTLPADFVDRVR